MNHICSTWSTRPVRRLVPFCEPCFRWGVSKACISFALERIQYWVSDPVNVGSARMEVRLGAFALQNSYSEPPSRAKKVFHESVRKSVGKMVWGLPVIAGALPPPPPGRADITCGTAW